MDATLLAPMEVCFGTRLQVALRIPIMMTMFLRLMETMLDAVIMMITNLYVCPRGGLRTT